MLRVHIFGAGSGIGKWFATRGPQIFGNTFAYDIDKKSIEALGLIDGISAVHLDADSAIKGDYLAPVFGNVHPGDWVFLAVPESQLAKLCKFINLHIPHDCFVAVMTSKQEQPVAMVSEQIPNARCCGLHPLFGPTVGSAHGQVIALCHDGDAPPEFVELGDCLLRAGLRLVWLSPSEHDEKMGYIQALTHFVLLSFVGVISESDFRLKDLMNMKTPPFQFLSAFSSRLLMANPATYASIQESKVSEKIRKTFLDFAHRLDSSFSEGTEGAARIEAIRKPFSGSTLDEFSQFSFMADAAVQARERYYFEILESKEVVVFQSVGYSDYRAGRITNVESTYIEVVEVLTRVPTEVGNRIPVPFDEVAIDAYRAQGINIKMSSPIRIKKGRFLLLSRTEANRWFDKNIHPIFSTVSVVNPTNLSEEVFEEWVPRFFSDIMKCEFRESYKQKGRLPSVKLDLVYHPSASLVKIEEKLRAFCYNFKPT